MCPADSFYKAILKSIFIPNKKKKCSHMYPYNIYICISLLLYHFVHSPHTRLNERLGCMQTLESTYLQMRSFAKNHILAS